MTSLNPGSKAVAGYMLVALEVRAVGRRILDEHVQQVGPGLGSEAAPVPAGFAGCLALLYRWMIPPIPVMLSVII